MPVLYGIFLYMGISSLNGIQFIDRFILIFMPEKYQTDYIYLRYVRSIRVHLFTFIQIMSIAILFTIKLNKFIYESFPIMVISFS